MNVTEQWHTMWWNLHSPFRSTDSLWFRYRILSETYIKKNWLFNLKMSSFPTKQTTWRDPLKSSELDTNSITWHWPASLQYLRFPFFHLFRSDVMDAWIILCHNYKCQPGFLSFALCRFWSRWLAVTLTKRLSRGNWKSGTLENTH